MPIWKIEWRLSMSVDHLVSDVTLIHRALLDHLSALDRLGEHVAAAHLTAAIDAIEDRIDVSANDHRRDSAGDPVEAMACGLIEMLGPQAQLAARQQITASSGQQLIKWAAIASRVDQMLVRGTAS
jgi:hypothetical protein